MAGEYDASEFIDTDFQAHSSPFAAPASAPTREEVDRKVVEAQQKLVELKRAQEELERERASLEELRRRQGEFQTSREEIIQNLTRGLGLLEEAEFGARREAEQMARTAADFREALGKVQSIREDAWSKDNFTMELTRALTTIENARMEWNSARLKLPVLAGENQPAPTPGPAAAATPVAPLAGLSFGALCRIGLAITWPLVILALVALGVFAAILLRH